MCAFGRMARERTITQGWVNVHFLSRFGTLEKGSANDRPRRANVRFLSRFGTLEKGSENDRPRRANVCFLSRFGTLEKGSVNDHPRMGDRSLPQCSNSHYARIKLKKK
jgi:gamma-glutamylcyclotransferase (GGCT)/AIG2-like uncharacterized protein YtfP